MPRHTKKNIAIYKFYYFNGEEIVNRLCRLAPVPSLFIDGELIFDAIPPIF